VVSLMMARLVAEAFLAQLAARGPWTGRPPRLVASIMIVASSGRI